jgi:DNA primase
MELDNKYNLFLNNLLKNHEAMNYLKDRGINSDLYPLFNLGICNPNNDHPFPLLKGRITLSIKDVHNRHVAFAGRQFEQLKSLTFDNYWNDLFLSPKRKEERINKWLKGKWLNESYLKSHHLYNLNNAKENIKHKDYVVVVEGYFDVIVLHSLGIKNVVAVCGTSLSEIHIALIKRYTNNIVLMLDPDKAGELSSFKQISKIENHRMNYLKVVLPDDTDPDDFCLQYGADFLKENIEKHLESQVKVLKIT